MYIAIAVFFNQSTYSVDESDVLYPVLVLSNPSLTDITVRMFSTDGSATGEYHAASSNYVISLSLSLDLWHDMGLCFFDTLYICVPMYK